MQLGYNTNGFGFHHWKDALEIIAEVGYKSVAITIDHHFLNPYASNFKQELKEVRQTLERLELQSVIETGARFLLNPKIKHDPTLLHPNLAQRARRIDFLKQSVQIANALNSNAVSFWAGSVRDDATTDEQMQRLIVGCREVLDEAEKFSMPLAFEPEPGMLIESMVDFFQLNERIAHPLFGLTIDIGHLQCVEGQSIPEILKTWSHQIFNIHIEDMKRNVHDHLFFGEGEIDFPEVMKAIAEINYTGGVHVELSRHSHNAVATAKQSFTFLKNLTHN